MVRRRSSELLLGEWASLGILYSTPAHGFAVAARLKPDADIGRIWSMSRALTYRSLEQLADRGLIEPIAEEPGVAGGTRTILATTRVGRAAFRKWVTTPVAHVRDLRSELLLKIVLARQNEIEITGMLDAQRRRIDELLGSFERDRPGDGTVGDDVVERWRLEAAHAAARFLDGLT